MTELYEGIADWWPVILPPSEYAEEAALYVEMMRSAARSSGLGPVLERSSNSAVAVATTPRT